MTETYYLSPDEYDALRRDLEKPARKRYFHARRSARRRRRGWA